MTIYPVLTYDDAHAAMNFLERAFRFERLQVHKRQDGEVIHAELRLGATSRRATRRATSGRS